MPNNIKKGGKPANKSKNRGWNLKRKSTGKPRNANPAGKNKDQQGKSDDNTSSSGQRESSVQPAMSSNRAISRANRLLWTYEETVALISIFEEKCIQDALSTTIRNYHIYDIVSSKMKEMGYLRTPNQCRVKVKNLKSEYKAAKCGDPRESRKVPLYLPLLEGLFGPKSEAGDSPPSTPVDVSMNHGSGSAFSPSPSDLKLMNVFQVDSMNNYMSEWKQSSGKKKLSHQPDLDFDVSSEKSSEGLSHKRNHEIEDDDEMKNEGWPTYKKKHKSLSSKAQKKIRALQMVMETISTQFIEHQEAAEQRFYEFERERMQHEAEMEDKRMMFMREEIERQNRDEERREVMMMQILERLLMFFENISGESAPEADLEL